MAKPTFEYTGLTEESFTEALDRITFHIPDTSKVMYVGPNTMRDIRWLMINKKWKYRRGKSGKIIRRPSKWYNSIVRMEKRMQII